MNQMGMEELTREAKEGQKRLDARIRRCVSCRDFAGALRLAGRNDYPKMFREWWEAGLLTRPRLRELLPVAWSMPDYPTRNGIRWWVDVFRVAGFVSDNEGAQVPDSDLTVYRGCRPGFRFSLAWTTSKHRAASYAKYILNRDGFPTWAAPPAVYRARFAPRHILAMFYKREEEEVVVNPWGLAQREQIG